MPGQYAGICTCNEVQIPLLLLVKLLISFVIYYYSNSDQEVKPPWSDEFPED
jgi:hypothetical protein